MNIGDQVLVDHIAVRDTIKPGNPDLIGWRRKLLKERRRAIYVGYTYKQEGIVHPESANGGSCWSEPRYEPAWFEQQRTVKLWRVKFHPRENDCFVFPQRGGNK